MAILYPVTQKLILSIFGIFIVISVCAQKPSNLIRIRTTQLKTIICGKILEDPQKPDTIYIRFLGNYINGHDEVEHFSYPLNPSGSFLIKLPRANRPLRINFSLKRNGFLIGFSKYQIIEPFDSINIFADLRNHKGFNFFAQYGGSGAVKFKCYQELASVNLDNKIIDRLYRINKPQSFINAIKDSILFKQFLILRKYQNSLHPSIYRIIKADIEAEVFNSSLYYFNINNVNLSIPEKELRKNYFAFFRKIIHFFESESSLAICESPEYLRFLINFREVDFCINHNGKMPDFLEMYSIIKASYTGLLRDKLFSIYFTESGRLAVDPELYSKLLNEAIEFIHTTYLKQALTLQLKINKGSKAFDFAMFVDSSNKMLRLSDLKGKVVLIDLWSYNCTACCLFTKIFHEKVYPLFEHDTGFQVISIMNWPNDDRVAYIHRLRNEDIDGKPIAYNYTFKEYLNLFGGSGPKEPKGGSAVQSYYRIHTAPFLMLIDKDGRVYSSTSTSFPFFTDSDSPNIEKLISMIRTVLATPSRS